MSVPVFPRAEKIGNGLIIDKIGSGLIKTILSKKSCLVSGISGMVKNIVQ